MNGILIAYLFSFAVLIFLIIFVLHGYLFSEKELKKFDKTDDNEI